ncbi:hypothetical protein [Streptomyces sp. IBSBF 2806]|uniref:hypothetical protein n=1 Tax=Streptomyces sp. IBSBF 2806 TaxID=2903529 RepID=UPI002FDBACF0
MGDPRLELAYKSLESELKVQTDTLAAFRNRATTLLSVAAIVATLSTGVGLTNPTATEPLPGWAPWFLLGIFAAVAVACMSVLWPAYPWWFVPSANFIMERYRINLGEDEVLKDSIDDLKVKVKRNAAVITRRAQYFRIGVLLFFVEMATLVIAAGTR